jgi:hypothetical protein
MPTTLTLALMASQSLPVDAVKQPPTAPPDTLDTPARGASVAAQRFSKMEASVSTPSNTAAGASTERRA